MQPDPPQADPRSDAELISSARLGDTSAFGALYERHAPAVTSVARYYARDNFTADDLVSEAFERTMAVLRRGGGPDVFFRAYVYTVVRRLAYDQSERATKIRVTDDFSAFELTDEVIDPAVNSFEGRVVTGAFASLPERWQAVLWYLEVEGIAPPVVAPLLGLTANGVSALAYRAREGLRQAYLQMHVTSTAVKPDCEPVRRKLGAYSRDDASSRDTTKIDSHLVDCDDCSAIVAELRDVSHGMRGIIAPFVLGGVAAAGLGFSSAPLRAAAATSVAVPTHPGRAGGGIGTLVSVAAIAAAAIVGAAALTGGQQLQAGLVAEQNPVGVVETPAVAPPARPSLPETRRPFPSPTKTVAPTRPPVAATPVRPSPPSAPAPGTTVSPPASPSTLTIPAGVPTLTIRMDEVGSLVLGRDGMVGAIVSNTGAVPASDVTVITTLPTGVTLDPSRSITGADVWLCNGGTEVISCVAPMIAVAQSISLYLPVSVAAGADMAAVPSVTVSGSGAATVTAQSASSVVASGLGTRFLVDGTYAVTQSGASFLSCDSSVLGCLAARQRLGRNISNDDYPMIAVNDVGFGAVSSATMLDLPAGATITNAGLYWSGLSSTSDIALEQALRLRGPRGSIADITADRVDHVGLSRGPTYQSFADVTDLVRGDGAGIWTASGADVSQTIGSYAGWALVVVYHAPSLASGRVAVFDGFQKVGDDSVRFEVAGLANSVAELGLVAWEGDAAITGDAIELDSVVLTRSHVGADSRNSMDSTAQGSTAANTFGVDVGSFLPIVLTKQQIPLVALTVGDHYVIGVVTVSSR
jgi:RNA polymerase sigma factor (sigma-70 family)